jgi:peptide/nickel transport system permease protein
MSSVPVAVTGVTTHTPSLSRRIRATLRAAGAALRRDKLGLLGACCIAMFVIFALFAPYIAPYGAQEFTTDDTGLIAKLEPPSLAHPLGTAALGQDVLSQIIWGSRSAVIVGFVSALLVAFIGTTVGLISGYFRGRTDTVLMRAVDVAYSMPFEPAALLLAVVFGAGLEVMIFAMALLMWRAPARVIRAQVLSLSQRPYVKAARCAGASPGRIILRHILPNVLGMSLLYIPIAVGWAVAAEAALSFLGFGDPERVSWGGMLELAFSSGQMRDAWWWTVPPGLAIVALISSAFFVSRALEPLTNPQLRGRS